MTQKFIPLSVPNLKGKELEYVTHAIETEWVSTAGPYINEFEDNVAKYTGARGAVSCQNGTSGLHIALRVLEVTSEDEVIVPTLTFIAAVNPVKYVGAEPIFMDCDVTLNINADKVRAFCETECDYINGKLINKTSKKHIKAIIVVHVFGNMGDMEKIMSIADEYNLKVVEDATEALGTYYTAGKYKDKHAGTIGDIGVYSFNGNKIMTTGGGGMIVSNNKELLKKAKHLTTQSKSDDLYYIHDDIGYNYRMTNLQAALGLAQLEQLEGFIETKKANYERYKTEIESIHCLSILDFNEHTRPNYWFYALSIDKGYKLNRDQLISYLSSNGIQSRPIWGLISQQIPYRANQTFKIEKAQIYLENVINIPCSSNLSKEDVQYVVECLQHPK
ncbi:aminotransferase DegT [Halolactibacillus miurensis]|uniref:Aminotransferase DegT n=1 Tax=Halolactibacillus miurensis TaxID=306541 RepID=A0A1I6TMS3_9BACI|nr:MULTISPECIES: LegC family aminotransferase [Halolactibacillus]GEM04725.1 aminotransferase DegT [Halolactibacillus miurensis]SFS90297.1 aminotransferase, LLPSF_NHT_00031 family [Halolactibacillus miurensis]